MYIYSRVIVPTDRDAATSSKKKSRNKIANCFDNRHHRLSTMLMMHCGELLRAAAKGFDCSAPSSTSHFLLYSTHILSTPIFLFPKASINKHLNLLFLHHFWPNYPKLHQNFSLFSSFLRISFSLTKISAFFFSPSFELHMLSFAIILHSSFKL